MLLVREQATGVVSDLWAGVIDQSIRRVQHVEQIIQQIQARISALLPPGLAATSAEFSDQFRQALREGLSKLDLVTRDEFEAQKAVLVRAQERLAQLEARVQSLEGQVTD